MKYYIITFIAGMIFHRVTTGLWNWNLRQAREKRNVPVKELEIGGFMELVYNPGMYNPPVDNAMFAAPDPALKKEYDGSLSLQVNLDPKKDVVIEGVKYVALIGDYDVNGHEPIVTEVEPANVVVINNDHLILYIDNKGRKHYALSDAHKLLDKYKREIIR